MTMTKFSKLVYKNGGKNHQKIKTELQRLQRKYQISRDQKIQSMVDGENSNFWSSNCNDCNS